MSTIPPQTLPTNQVPSTIEYGGDEISALVLDPGTAWTRAGFAGEDTPKTVMPTSYGAIGDGESAKLLFGDNDVHSLRAGMEIRNPMADGIVQDWDRIPALWRYALTSRLTSNISEHPLLMTEPAWNPPKNREKTMEVAFEDFNVPAFYLARSAVCSGFASGKASGLVVDVGASNVAVTPIHDGFILRKGVMHAPIGGDFLSAQIRQYLAHTNIPLTPHYQVLAKTQVDVGQPAKATLRDPKTFPATDSYRRFQEERVLTEFKECVVQVWPGPGPLPPTGDNAYGARTFEFPDGFNLVFGGERYHLAEGLFNTQRAIAPLPADGSSAQAQGVTSLVWAAMKDVDLELKQHILSNVVVVGAGSLLYGFTDRLNGELSSAFPGPRVRITAPGNSIERRYSAWLGGSILASLGSFHQMWVSKKEYEEHGANIVEKRCK